jgi:hypothetical protein
MHPEQYDNEVLIGNCNLPDYTFRTEWKTKRLGKIAYDVNGNPIKDLFPVFVSKEEIKESGLDYMLEPTFNIYGVKSV